jgi:two-component system phosphate regulon sensor histidine kinase PhoR
MNTLIQDIILVSKLDEGMGSDAFEDVDLCAVALEASEALSLSAKENEIPVSVECGESGAVVIRADRSMMYELFYNLIDNAVKYNRPGGEVRVGVNESGGDVCITVADTGIGIPKKSQSRVFERFYRVDKSRSKKKGGTGLGLAIVKHIVITHEGRIDLESNEGEGTTIKIQLPATPAAE